MALSAAPIGSNYPFRKVSVRSIFLRHNAQTTVIELLDGKVTHWEEMKGGPYDKQLPVEEINLT